jgi:DNA (cytosine-5)-methyltransferase 1
MPRALVVENVPDFARWTLFPAWCDALNRLGYRLAAHVIDSADLGVPQHRRRMFVVGVRAKSALWLSLDRREHVPAATFLGSGGRWSMVASKCSRTRERVAAGRIAHGHRFLVAYYGSARGGRSIHRPIGTITTRDRYASVDGDFMRMLTTDEYRAAMGFPAGYVLPENHRLATHLLGNAVCPPVAEEIVRQLSLVA